MLKKIISATVFSLLLLTALAQEKRMDETWNGNSQRNARAGNRGEIFRDGRYAMFIHWGLYSQLANKWNGKTYYGIGEWLMSKHLANIPVKDYKEVAKSFNPKKFDAKAIVQLAKDAGMKYIVITSKHHDGFAMFHSKHDKFNIVDATPFGRDPMKELAKACKDAGLGFGFYYSQNYDWTTPGGGGDAGPTKGGVNKDADFDEYFRTKCLPQVEQITTEYGPIALVWFDTPGDMPRKYAEKLVEVVHKNQPGAFVSGRVGHGFGDYSTLGDMEVPKKNVPGLWESVDVTNDAWGYAWYDENWKSPKQILTNVLSTVARGGNYMLNLGPRNDGSIPAQAAAALRSSGDWIRRYPQVVYKGERSPWQHVLPWGDAIVQDRTISLLVYDWPSTGKLYVPGLQSNVKQSQLLINGTKRSLKFKREGNWLVIDIPKIAPEKLVSVIQLICIDDPKADPAMAIDPQSPTILDAVFSNADKAIKSGHSWMEKFGEWKHIDQVRNWLPDASASWTVDVQAPGYYQTLLNYAGKDRVVWRITNGEKIVQNQQSASSVYSWYPMGWLHFEKAGRYNISVSLIEGDGETTSLAAMRLEPVVF